MTNNNKLVWIIPVGLIVLVLFAAGFFSIDFVTTLDWKFLVGIPVVALIAWMIFGPKGTKSAMKGMSLGESLFAGMGLIIIGVPLFILAVGAFSFLFGVGNWASDGALQDNLDRATGTPVYQTDPGCNLREYVGRNGLTIPSAGAVITICPGDGRVYLAAEHRMGMIAMFDENFAQANRNVLSSRFPSDFYTLTRGGGTVNAFELTVFDSGFTSSGLNSVKLFIRSVR